MNFKINNFNFKNVCRSGNSHAVAGIVFFSIRYFYLVFSTVILFFVPANYYNITSF